MTAKAAKGKKESAGSTKVSDLIEALATTGMPKGIARTLAFLTTQDDWSTSKDIENATRLRQPEVSIAVRHLVSMGWVERDSLKRETKGRPINIYRMSVDMGKVYEAIEEGEKDKISGIRSNLSDIKSMWSLQ